MFKQLYGLLTDNYNKPKSKEQYEMFCEVFENEDEIYLEKVVKKIIKEDKFMPSIARIKEVVEEMYNEPLTEKDKLKRWEKEGIKPSYLTKDPEEINISDEEIEDLKDFFSQFK